MLKRPNRHPNDTETFDRNACASTRWFAAPPSRSTSSDCGERRYWVAERTVNVRRPKRRINSNSFFTCCDGVSARWILERVPSVARHASRHATSAERTSFRKNLSVFAVSHASTARVRDTSAAEDASVTENSSPPTK